MGNSNRTFECVITKIQPSVEYVYGTKITIFEHINTRNIYLSRNNPKYAEILNTIQINKPYVFTVKDGWTVTTLLEINKPKIYIKTIKVMTYIELSKQYPELNGWFEVIYNHGIHTKLIIDNNDILKIGEEYTVTFSLYGVDDLYEILTYKKV